MRQVFDRRQLLAANGEELALRSPGLDTPREAGRSRWHSSRPASIDRVRGDGDETRRTAAGRHTDPARRSRTLLHDSAARTIALRRLPIDRSSDRHSDGRIVRQARDSNRRAARRNLRPTRRARHRCIRQKGIRCESRAIASANRRSASVKAGICERPRKIRPSCGLYELDIHGMYIIWTLNAPRARYWLT